MSTETDIEQEDFQTGGIALVASAHAVHDTFTAFLPALLPVLIQKFSLTNTAAGLLSVFLEMPSILQPFIGYLADRKNLRILIILAPTISGAGMSMLGIAPSYGFLIFFLLIAGVSSASLHAVGPVLGSSLSGKQLGKGMSFWMVGGELGRALGPIIIVTAITYLTLERLPWLMLAGVFASLSLHKKLRSISTLPRNNPSLIHWKKALRRMNRILMPISVIIFTRSLVIASLTTYLPTFLTQQGTSLLIAGASLSILEVSGMLGAFFAGSLSDRFGRRKMLVVSFIVTPILMLLFIYTNNFNRIPLLILLGFFAISVVPVIMAIVLENAPENRSLTNGVFMAVSFGLKALSIFLIGFLSDLISMQFTFIISAGLLLIGFPFIFRLPKHQN